jgi:hypothetical protein
MYEINQEIFFVRQEQRGSCQESENQMQLGNFK